jgi:hypothetical protein
MLRIRLCSGRSHSLDHNRNADTDRASCATIPSLELVHANRRHGRPTASPSGAPGRDSSHSWTAASTSASVASGRMRRMRVCCMRTPNSAISKARRRRCLAILPARCPAYRPEWRAPRTPEGPVRSNRRALRIWRNGITRFR